MPRKTETSLPYRGTTRPTRVGKMRILVTLVMGVVFALFVWRGVGDLGPVVALLGLLIFAASAFWTWAGLRTEFTVDDTGIHIRRGGLFPVPLWPGDEFRSVHYRLIEDAKLTTTVRYLGPRQHKVPGGHPHELREAAGMKLFTTGLDPYPTMLNVSAGGTLVEIVGSKGRNFLLSPQDPEGTAEAIGDVIELHRGRR